LIKLLLNQQGRDFFCHTMQLEQQNVHYFMQ